MGSLGGFLFKPQLKCLLLREAGHPLILVALVSSHFKEARPWESFPVENKQKPFAGFFQIVTWIKIFQRGEKRKWPRKRKIRMMLRRKAELHFLLCRFTERLRGVGADSKGQVCKPDYCHAPWSNQMLTIKALWKIPRRYTPLGTRVKQTFRVWNVSMGLWLS